MIPGAAALCEGTVSHRRFVPEPHHFTYPISQVWIDPDEPEALCDLHPAWSDRRPAPVRYRRSDYGRESAGSLADAARNDLERTIGRPPQGAVRMLSQLRRWGWLFNPITMYFVWDQDPSRPTGAVLEVTNTPWKERVRYPVSFDSSTGSLTATFDKAMHVSPFIGMQHQYRLSVQDRDDIVSIDLDVVDHDDVEILHTATRLHREPANRALLGESIRSTPFPTHRVSAGIHRQAARLWAKGVPFVRHPDKSTDTRTSTGG